MCMQGHSRLVDQMQRSACSSWTSFQERSGAKVLRHAHCVAFDKSDLLFICMMRPLTTRIEVDNTEIQAAKLHPVFILIGFIILGGEAIISYKALPWSKEVNKLIHLVLHAIATVLGAVGIYTAFKYHNESGIANLYSLHSWVGLGTICLYAIQWLYGFVTFFFPGGLPALRRASLPWHVFLGLFVYVLAIATAELGFLEKLTFLENGGLDKYGPEAFLVNFTAPSSRTPRLQARAF